MYVNNEWIDSESGEVQKAINPANSQTIDTFPRATREDVQRAIDCAVEAYSRAENMTAYERYKVLLKVSQLLEEHSSEMSRLISQNVGKPIADAEAETARGVLTLSFAAEEAKRIYGQTFPLDSHPFPAGNKNRLGFTIREPLGVVGAISPFNFPLNLLLHKIAPAIAAGNCVVAKPPSDGPLPGLLIAKFFEEAGLPKGILNVVTGSGSVVGAEIVENPKISAITFTGDSTTGQEIAEKAARTNKKTILELGGHDPMVILDDANVTKAVNSAVRGVFTFSGQVCTATKRIIIENKNKEQFVDGFTKAVKALRVGDPIERSTDVGPVINLPGLNKIEQLVSEALDGGAEVLAGGKRIEEGQYAHGFFFQPTVLDRVAENMEISQKEIFGPVAPILVAENDEHAIQIANGTAYGLQSSIFTSNMARGLRLARKIKAGAVLINDRTNLRWDNAPFGGIKRSGLGREGVSVAITELTETKFIVANLEE